MREPEDTHSEKKEQRPACSAVYSCKRKGKARAGFFAQELYGSRHWLFKGIKAGLWEIDMMDAAEKESAKLQDVGGNSRSVRQMWSQQVFPQLAAVVTKNLLQVYS